MKEMKEKEFLNLKLKDVFILNSNEILIPKSTGCFLFDRNSDLLTPGYFDIKLKKAGE